MELIDPRISNVTQIKTLNIKEVSQKNRSNYLYIFVGLDSGTRYQFRVKACSSLGPCGNWSSPLLNATTSDGYAEAPRSVSLVCTYENGINFGDVRWQRPRLAFGTVIGYNITLSSYAIYRDESNVLRNDVLHEWFLYNNTDDLLYHIPILRPNTNYSARICAVNKSGCGAFSNITLQTKCTTSPVLPERLPTFKLMQSDHLGQLKLSLPRISERNGSIACYKLLLIKLPINFDIERLSDEQSMLNISTYAQTTATSLSPVLYIADEFDTDNLRDEIIIGDGNHSSCNKIRTTYGRLIANDEAASLANQSGAISMIEDGPLATGTYYSGFVLINVIDSRGIVLSKASVVFEPVRTIPLPRTPSWAIETNSFAPILSIVGNPIATVAFCLVVGFILVLLIVLLAFCTLIRSQQKTSPPLATKSGEASVELTAEPDQKQVYSNGFSSNSYFLPLDQNHSCDIVQRDAACNQFIHDDENAANPQRAADEIDCNQGKLIFYIFTIGESSRSSMSSSFCFIFNLRLGTFPELSLNFFADSSYEPRNLDDVDL